MFPLGLHSNRSQKTSKCGKKISETLSCTLRVIFFKTHFDVICDMSLNRHTATWNLIVKLMG